MESTESTDELLSPDTKRDLLRYGTPALQTLGEALLYLPNMITLIQECKTSAENNKFENVTEQMRLLNEQTSCMELLVHKAAKLGIDEKAANDETQRKMATNLVRLQKETEMEKDKARAVCIDLQKQLREMKKAEQPAVIVENLHYDDTVGLVNAAAQLKSKFEDDKLNAARERIHELELENKAMAATRDTMQNELAKSSSVNVEEIIRALRHESEVEITELKLRIARQEESAQHTIVAMKAGYDLQLSALKAKSNADENELKTLKEETEKERKELRRDLKLIKCNMEQSVKGYEKKEKELQTMIKKSQQSCATTQNKLNNRQKDLETVQTKLQNSQKDLELEKRNSKKAISVMKMFHPATGRLYLICKLVAAWKFALASSKLHKQKWGYLNAKLELLHSKLQCQATIRDIISVQQCSKTSIAEKDKHDLVEVHEQKRTTPSSHRSRAISFSAGHLGATATPPESEEIADNKYMVQKLRKLDEQYDALKSAHEQLKKDYQQLKEDEALREQFETGLYHDNLNLHNLYWQATESMQNIINSTRPGLHCFENPRRTFADFKEQLARAAENSRLMNNRFTSQNLLGS